MGTILGNLSVIWETIARWLSILDSADPSDYSAMLGEGGAVVEYVCHVEFRACIPIAGNLKGFLRVHTCFCSAGKAVCSTMSLNILNGSDWFILVSWFTLHVLGENLTKAKIAVADDA